METKEERIQRLKEARQKYSNLSRPKLNKTTTVSEFNLNQKCKIDTEFKPSRANYNKILSNNCDTTNDKFSLGRPSIKPKQSIAGMKLPDRNLFVKKKTVDIKNINIDEESKLRLINKLHGSAERLDQVNSAQTPSGVKEISESLQKLEFTEVQKITYIHGLHGREIPQPLQSCNNKNIGTSVNRPFNLEKDETFKSSSENVQKILINNYECETPLTSKLTKQPKQSILSFKVPKCFNSRSTSEGLENVIITDESKKRVLALFQKNLGKEPLYDRNSRKDCETKSTSSNDLKDQNIDEGHDLITPLRSALRTPSNTIKSVTNKSVKFV
uniref:Uncharacterized protein n=1 Tax=Parastrongyloides trichosuri TaxID=131310 RepID=A0A0N4ZMX0_PARTI